MKNRKRNRMQGFDYSSDNLYFVTICVQDRICCFGSVGTGRDLSVHHSNENHSNENHSNENQFENNCADLKMDLNEFGKIVKQQIEWLEEQYKYVEIHNYVVMPNHVHMIIEIDKNKLLIGTEGTARELSVQEIKIKSLSGLIGAFKTTSSKLIHRAGFEDFSWQRSFHDHIIRNDKSYHNISNYIDLNPEKLVSDTFFANR
ncbi:transposase [Flavobacterium gyeonganense]|uniref:Transposase n=1 Tax=Flavobacterium gyeonganense TaxID=1310418 RepID=A0ABV5H9S0_9FLAO|nr:transposase [Flavobacterium gyeonganense]